MTIYGNGRVFYKRGPENEPGVPSTFVVQIHKFWYHFSKYHSIAHKLKFPWHGLKQEGLYSHSYTLSTQYIVTLCSKEILYKLFIFHQAGVAKR